MTPRELHPFEMFGGPKDHVSSGIVDFGPNPIPVEQVEEPPDDMGYSASRSVYGASDAEPLVELPVELIDELEPDVDEEGEDSPRDHEDPIIDDDPKDSTPA